MVPLASFAIALALLVVPAAHATADSITITTVTVLQSVGCCTFFDVDLGAHPGAIVGPSGPTHPGFETALSFNVIFSPLPQDTTVHYDMTFQVDGVALLHRSRTLMLSESANNQGVLETFDPGECCYTPTPGTLSTLFNGSTSIWKFTLLTPIPEPGTWVLAATAVGLLIARWYWRGAVVS